MNSPREIWVDYLRVVACLMVMVVHSTEPFYLGGDGSLVLSRMDGFWSALIDSMVRSCVPLFVIASSYLQFPIHYSAGDFFRRRCVRILIPFVIWSVVYAIVWGEPVKNLHDLILNFNYAAGHLWFVYMLIGVYVLMPLLSPWAERVGRKELLAFLLLWLFTTTFPFIREAASGGDAPLIYGPSGIPNPAKFPLWGEASWNTYGSFYYISGFIGYLLLGLYIRKFGSGLTGRKAVLTGIGCWLAGLAIAFGGFYRRILDSAAEAGGFPVGGDVKLATVWETSIGFETTGVVLMALGLILVFRQIKSGESAFYRKVILPLSKAGYGMYLIHMLILAAFSGLFRGWLGIGADGVLGIWTTPVEILLTAFCSFICVGTAATLVQRIPKIGKFLMG